ATPECRYSVTAVAPPGASPVRVKAKWPTGKETPAGAAGGAGVGVGGAAGGGGAGGGGRGTEGAAAPVGAGGPPPRWLAGVPAACWLSAMPSPLPSPPLGAPASTASLTPSRSLSWAMPYTQGSSPVLPSLAVKNSRPLLSANRERGPENPAPGLTSWTNTV